MPLSRFGTFWPCEMCNLWQHCLRTTMNGSCLVFFPPLSRYEISESGSSERATLYFAVDAETGEITVIDDLTKEIYDEYRVSSEMNFLKMRNNLAIVAIKVVRLIYIPTSTKCHKLQQKNVASNWKMLGNKSQL